MDSCEARPSTHGWRHPADGPLRTGIATEPAAARPRKHSKFELWPGRTRGSGTSPIGHVTTNRGLREPESRPDRRAEPASGSHRPHARAEPPADLSKAPSEPALLNRLDRWLLVQPAHTFRSATPARSNLTEGHPEATAAHPPGCHVIRSNGGQAHGRQPRTRPDAPSWLSHARAQPRNPAWAQPCKTSPGSGPADQTERRGPSPTQRLRPSAAATRRSATGPASPPSWR